MKKLLLILVLLPFILNAVNVNIETPRVEGNKIVNALPIKLDIGNPAVPYVPVKLLLPMGQKLKNISVTFQNENVMEISTLDHVRKPQPISLATPDNTPINSEIYGSNSFYPNQDFQVLGTQRYKGFELLLVNLYPYKFNPVKNELTWYENAEIDFNTEIDLELESKQNNNLILNDDVINSLQRLTVNYQEAITYRKSTVASNRTLVDPNDPFTMLIITDTERAPYFDDYLVWRNDHGVSTALFLVEDIYTEYTGVNDQEKIKNFIIDAYQAYSTTDTPLEHILLGGDDEIIPIRTVYINTGSGTVDEHMPCDAYYSCLDNNWDGNANGIYGELGDDVDLIPEIAVGRIPAETEDEFNRFFNKTYEYVDEVSVSDDMVYKFGENLNNNPLTWGGDYMDEVIDEVPSLQDDYHIFKLYDREGTFSTQTVKSAINNGVAIINHMGHSNETMVFGQNVSHCSSYTNTEFGFAYSQGCYPAAFDEATSHSGESIAENLVIAEGGLYAFVGNTRYGWYSPGSTNGPSQPYDIEFFKAIFTNDIRELGTALSESRVVLANEAATNHFLRWVHYELVLFGDPSVGVKYANGNFPFITPGEVVYEDSNTGDGDGIPNPGEEIEIYIELINQDGWADATDVSASIDFEDPTIQLITGSVNYGAIQNGSGATADPFLVQVPQDCEYDSYSYTLTVTAPVNANANFEKEYVRSFEVSLFQKNWPWQTDNSILSNPIIFDFDDNGSRNLMLIDADANVNLLGYNANMVSGYPWTNEENVWKSTALADITNDDEPEIVIASRTGRIFAIDNSGNVVLDYQANSDQLLTPIVADFDGDNENEIVSFGMDKFLNVVDTDGSMLSNFPIEMPMLTFQEMASADLDEDGAYDILIGSLNGQFHAIANDAEELTGFPVDLGIGTCTAPIVLDNLKIVIGTNDSKLHIIDNEGNILLQKDTAQKIATSPIAADFDNDDELEIAYVTLNGILSIIEQDGTELSGWPIDTECNFINPPITADIDNDDDLELIALSSANNMFVYHHNGTEVEFAPVPVGMVGNTPASLEDIDWDGDYDVISGLSTGAFVIDIKLPKGLKTPWKTYRGNYSRTGFYSDNELFTHAGEILPEVAEAALNQNFPNPFNPVTTISFALNEGAEVDLDIYNIRGQKVRTLISSESFEKGVIEVEWNGKDNAGKSVGTGVYFYKLKVDNNEIDTRKCLLLK
ncbi:MAG: T9SS type A sorting domain-containing protein [Candidatus Cloacimonetes bacterium]|nr:T9SS type A sorting domain-containing protein [Candidatus Cloacimonadota bacterium]MCF7813368.1 T9SS type A sorting domain-containing protein [Candidatus Cloacimonadota bacterium]MCF7867507.1 T9SS type A sorting domain-containing protein [Candidatus Cloacimonadota bacterium]MCF7882991.1 T9SS type A sorting domain-containing protein [Candidatus Cloacimonadota bacterium]